MRRLFMLISFAASVLVASALVTGAQAASPPATEGRAGMVVSSQHLAAEAGRDILRQGGNAVDAAVAVAYAEAVTNPCCGNIGGGGFLILRLADGREAFINFRETAPRAATRDMYLGADGQVVARASLDGWKAAGVPGSVAGLDLALARYGSLPRAVVMAPAIRLAREGFVLTHGDTDIVARAVTRLKRDPEAARVFVRPDGSVFEPGDRLIQPDLANTLEAIAIRGPAAFYQGRVPALIEAAARAGGGLLSEADFAAYRAIETTPLRCRYRGYEIASAPPPSSGGVTLCLMLGVLEGFDLRAAGWNSARAIHLVTEAARHAYLDRNMLLGDPDFVPNPVERLLSTEYASQIRARIGAHATQSAAVLPGTPPHEKPETTHLSVLDRHGGSAAITFTINGGFGAGVMAPDTGFLLNNEMDDFTVKPGVANLFGLVQGERNAIAPGKRPLSSMAPTIVTRDGQVVMVLGSPGGARIITIVLQTILNLVDHGMAPQEAVDAPRVHHQWLPDMIFAEPRAISADTRAVLEAWGHKITEQAPWGAMALITRGLASGGAAASAPDAAVSGRMRPGFVYGANDSRRPAGAALAE
jgi:gamma-glutamyltranspeptidase/glutathione hydrolase